MKQLGYNMENLPGTDSFKVLLIEDNPIDRKLIQDFLKNDVLKRFHLTETNKLESGLQLLSQENFDIILLDLYLTDARNLEALDKILSYKAEIPIIILTGLSDDDLGVSAVRKGAQDYLIKGDFNRLVLIRSIMYSIERKEAEIALKESEDRFRRLSEVSFEGILIHDKSMIIDANQTFLKMFGYSYSEIRELDGFNLMQPPMKEKAENHVYSGYEGVYDTLGVKKDGTTFPIEVQAKSIAYNNRKMRVVSVRDITERKKAEMVLKRSEERFKKVFEGAPIGIALVDLNCQFDQVNEVFRLMLGYSEEEITNITFCDLIHPEHVNRDIAYLEKIKKGEYATYKTENRYLKRNGGILYSKTSITLLPQKYNQPNYYLVMIEDITIQKKIEEETRKKLMRYKIEDGNLYLITESVSNLSRQVFIDLLELGYSGYVISSFPEAEFKNQIDIEFKYFWLSETRNRNSLSPEIKEIESLFKTMTSKSVVFIDRLDYLILKNGFNETLKIVFKIRELAYLNNFVIILSVDPSTLSKYQIRMLEKETKVVEPRVIARIPDEMLNILKFIYQQNNLGIKPSYTEIGVEFEISKPTTRKKIKNLVSTGYLNEHRIGARKKLELTAKSILLFTKK